MAERTGWFVNLDDLDLGENMDLMEYLGIDDANKLVELAEKGHPKVIVGFVWLIRRRTDPTFTTDDARLIKFSELATEIAKVNDPNAPGGSERRSTGSTSRKSATTTATRRRNSTGSTRGS